MNSKRSEKYEAMWERATLSGPGRYTNGTGTHLLALWDKGNVAQFIQTDATGCSCGDDAVVVSNFEDGTQYQGDHRNFGERHGYGCQVINQVNKQYLWRGEWRNDARFTGVLTHLNRAKIVAWWNKGVESQQPSRAAEAAADLADKRANLALTTETDIRLLLPNLVAKVVSECSEIEEEASSTAAKALIAHHKTLATTHPQDCFVTRERVSLLCPLSMALLKIPVRGIRCFVHKQCFDKTMWLSTGCTYCPICNSVILSEKELVVDGVVQSLVLSNPGEMDLIDYPLEAEEATLEIETASEAANEEGMECIQVISDDNPSDSQDDSTTQPVTQPIEVEALKQSDGMPVECPDIVGTLIEQFNNSYEGAKASLVRLIQLENEKLNTFNNNNSDVTFSLDIRVNVIGKRNGDMGIHSLASVSVERGSGNHLNIYQREE